MKKLALALMMLAWLSAPASAQKFEGLALTPPMGWNTWNTFNTNINETLIRETAKVIVDSGMRDAGYKYVVLDDAWSTRARDDEGNLVADPQKFPSGMKALGDFLHESGLKFGIYNCAGTRTCAGYPGGHGYEEADAKLYASWGVDYLKYDWCNTRGFDPQESYKAMRDALHDAGRPVVFSICEWGSNQPWKWAEDVGHLWRTTQDIGAMYINRGRFPSGWKTIADAQADQGLEKYAGPDHWNDPDMLEVGNGRMTLAESRGHFSFWCVLAAPLMAGNDVRRMSDEIRDILIDKEAIAIDQDPLGKQGYRFAKDAGKEVWVKELSDGKWAVLVHNPTTDKANLSVAWKDLTFLKGTYKVRNTWEKKDIGTTETDFTGEVDVHDVALLVLTPVEKPAEP